MIATTCHALRKRLLLGPTNGDAGTPPLEGPGSARCSPLDAALLLRTPKLRCKSEQPALGPSRPRLRTPASAGPPSQSSSGRDSGGGCPVRVKVAGFGVSLRGWLRSSDIGCGFEDAGPVRPEDCFPVPSLNVVHGASASPAGREFEIAYVDAESVARRLALIDAWSVPFEECMPVRGFPSYKGQRNHVGRWWTATTGSLVGYESWLERDWLMLLDFDPDVVGIAAHRNRVTDRLGPGHQPRQCRERGLQSGSHVRQVVARGPIARQPAHVPDHDRDRRPGHFIRQPTSSQAARVTANASASRGLIRSAGRQSITSAAPPAERAK